MISELSYCDFKYRPVFDPLLGMIQLTCRKDRYFNKDLASCSFAVARNDWMFTCSTNKAMIMQ